MESRQLQLDGLSGVDCARLDLMDLPTEMVLLIMSFLRLTDFDVLPSASVKFLNNYLDWQLMKLRFKRHFPKEFDALTADEQTNWCQQFSSMSRVAYQGSLLSPSQKKKFFHLREHDVVSLKTNAGDYTFVAEDLYPETVDAHGYSLVDYAFQTGQQEYLNYCYAQIKQLFVTTLAGDVSMIDNLGGLTIGWSLLCWAVYLNQDQQELQRLIDAGHHINGHPDKRQSPLGIAAMCGRVAAAKFLLDSDEVNIEWGRAVNSPLLLAVAGGHSDICRLLIDRGARVDARDMNQHSPLHMAARGGYVEVVAMLFHAGADINYQAANPLLGPSALHFAIKSGDEATVRFLIMHGADLHAECGGKLATTLAVDARSLPLLKLLVEEGAPIISDNPHILSTFVASAIAGEKVFFDFLLACDEVRSRPDLLSCALFYAAKHGHAAIVETLLGLSVNPHVQYLDAEYIFTAQEVACANGHQPIANSIAYYMYKYDHPDLYDALAVYEKRYTSELGFFARQNESGRESSAKSVSSHHLKH